MSSDRIAISVEGLGKKYRLGAGGSYGRLTESLSSIPRRLKSGSGAEPSEFWALRDITIEIPAGEIVGVIGANGAGKSTLLKILSRITRPTEGRAELRGRVGSLLEVGTGFHPELTGRENVYLSGAILGMRREHIATRFDEIVDFSGIGAFLDTPVKRYSSGMQVRLGFAVAAHLDTEILLIDEVLAVGDIEFQRKCLDSMRSVSSAGRTVVFVSHNLAAIRGLCTRGLVLEKGNVTAIGHVDDAVGVYLERAHRIMQTSLQTRSDRKGNGALRVGSIKIDGVAPGLPPTLGEPMTITLNYHTAVDRGNITASIGVYDANGGVALGLGSDVTGDGITTSRPHGAIVCQIPRLPLVPGRYTINVYVEVNGDIADWVQSAARFDVELGDFFGTGRSPHANFGSVLTDHTWSGDPADLDPLPTYHSPDR